MRRSVNLTPSLSPLAIPHLARSPLCVLTIFQIPKAALPTKWLFRGRPLFRSSFVASSRQ